MLAWGHQRFVDWVGDLSASSAGASSEIISIEGTVKNPAADGTFPIRSSSSANTGWDGILCSHECRGGRDIWAFMNLLMGRVIIH